MFYFFVAFGYRKKSLFRLEEKDRFRYILELRNTDQDLIDYLLCKEPAFPINYEVLYSKIVLKRSNNVIKEITCVNKQLEDNIQSKYIFDSEEEIDEIIFYPFVDVGGFAQIDNCSVDNIKLNSEGTIQYLKKLNGGIRLHTGVISLWKHNVMIDWLFYFC